MSPPLTAATGEVAKMHGNVKTAQTAITESRAAMAKAEAAVGQMAKEKVEPMQAAVTTAAKAMAATQAAHANLEKDHQARVAALTKQVETQSATAKAKQTAADKFAGAMTETRKKLEALEAEYQNLKSAAASSAEPT